MIAATELMDSGPPTQLSACRSYVTTFLEAHADRRSENAAKFANDAGTELTGDIAADMAAVVRAKSFQYQLWKAGLAGITWPKEYGGAALTREHQELFDREAADFDLPITLLIIGLAMCAPTILALGSPEQRARHVPSILRGEEVWCQLFSEPGAGSDLASLQTRAVQDGDQWVLNGQKVWSSGAHFADFGVVLARTDPDQPKHAGITMFIIDMKSPGVTVRPLRQITGGASFNEVFLDDVRTPTSNIIGELNGGWRAALAMLGHERMALGTGDSGGWRPLWFFEHILAMARERNLVDDSAIRQQLTAVYASSRILELIRHRIHSAARSGQDAGPVGSVAKLADAILARRCSDLGIAIAGPSGQAWLSDEPSGNQWALAVLSAPIASIAGGTVEIQRNIIGERILGLAREPEVDRTAPFRSLRVGAR